MPYSRAVDILRDNRLMRTSEEAKVFDQTVIELTKSLDTTLLPDLYRVFDDKTQHPEVMWGLVHLLEDYDAPARLHALGEVIPDLLKAAPEWTEILHCRILNSESDRRTYKSILSSLPARNQDLIRSILRAIAANDEDFKDRVEFMLH